MFKTQNISSNSYINVPISAAAFPNKNISVQKEKTFWGNIPHDLESTSKSDIKTQLTREVTYHIVRDGQWQLISKIIKI